jgi:hypothetical protein
MGTPIKKRRDNTINPTQRLTPLDVKAYQNGIYRNELNAWAALELVKGCHLHPVVNELNARAVLPQ